MRAFKTPFVSESEDKIIGGYLSLRQTGWLLLPFAILFYLFIMNRNYIIQTTTGMTVNGLSITFRIIVVVIALVVSAIFAFLKVDGITADKYVIKFTAYKLRKKVYKRGE